MENCSLALAGAPAGDVELDVWALADAPRRPGRRLNANLDVRTLTWASRPARKEHIGVLGVVGGTPGGETRMFACPSGSYHTLEIGCATTRGCDVDILGVGHGQSGAFTSFSLLRRTCTDPRGCLVSSSHRDLREAVPDFIARLTALQIHYSVIDHFHVTVYCSRRMDGGYMTTDRMREYGRGSDELE